MSNHRFIFVTSSQGTAAGLEGELSWSNYPLLVQEQIPEIDCRFWMMSELSVDVVDNLFREIIMQHRPDFIILQCGIIECALRILPKKSRVFLSLIPGGKFITKLLYENRKRWLRFLNLMGLAFTDINKETFENHLINIYNKCNSFGFKLIVLKIPFLSEQCEQSILPKNNQVIKEYNDVLDCVCKERGISVLDPFENNVDFTRNSLYQTDSVHFSQKGHQMIADSLVRFIKNKIL